MYRLRLSVLAEQDIEAILVHSEANFRERARLQCAALLEASLREFVGDPKRSAVRVHDDLGSGIPTYCLFYAREHARSRAHSPCAAASRLRAIPLNLCKTF